MSSHYGILNYCHGYYKNVFLQGGARAVNPVQRNAFEVLMSSQQQLSLKSMPDLIEEPKTAKQKLRNSIITFLTERNCQWRGGDEVSSMGSNLIHATLWTIDGHHHVFSNQNIAIP